MLILVLEVDSLVESTSCCLGFWSSAADVKVEVLTSCCLGFCSSAADVKVEVLTQVHQAYAIWNLL